MLKELEEILPEIEGPFIIYFKSLREFDRVCVKSNFETEDREQNYLTLNNFFLYECFD